MRQLVRAWRVHLCAPAAAAAAFLLVSAAVEAAAPHRYEVSMDPSLERLAVRACFAGQAPPALVAQSDGARFCKS